MKRIVLNGLLTGISLLAAGFLVLFISVRLFPSIAWEYFGPSFNTDGNRDFLFYIHPFILGLALAWLWERIKTVFTGNWLLRGLEMGLVYALVATLPAMWITFSAINVSIAMVLTWFLYGLFQAIISGMLLARLSP